MQTQMIKMCIPHSMVQCSWPHGHPVKSQLQQQARQARYHLLATECARLKINHLLLAHQLNDQIGKTLIYLLCIVKLLFLNSILFLETVIHRIGRASGIDGLSGMKMVTRWKSNSSLLLIRPLLNFTRVCFCRLGSWSHTHTFLASSPGICLAPPCRAHMSCDTRALHGGARQTPEDEANTFHAHK